MNSKERLEMIANLIREAEGPARGNPEGQIMAILAALVQVLEELKNPAERLEELKRREPFRALFLG